MILVRKAKQYPGASARHHPRPSRSAQPLNNWLDEAPHPICCCVLLCWNEGIGKLRSCWHLRIIHQPYLALTDVVVHERECNPILPLTFDNIRPTANRHHVSLAAPFLYQPYGTPRLYSSGDWPLSRISLSDVSYIHTVRPIPFFALTVRERCH